MPRRSLSSSIAAGDKAQQRTGPLGKFITDQDFADMFQCEASSKFGRKMASTPHDDAEGDAEMVVDGGRNGSPASRLSGRGSLEFEAAPVILVELELRQLKEDCDGLHCDMEWTGQQVGLANITPAESRTYQLRLLELSHQLRQTNHRIHMREAETHNHRLGLSPVASNQQVYAGNIAQRAFFMNAQVPQEHRRPGQPIGSKNRLKGSLKPLPTPEPQAPAKNPQKAAAPAIAGAKRILPDEITVAIPADEMIEPAHLAKRPRVEFGSPVRSPAEDDSKTAIKTGTCSAHTVETTGDDIAVENGQSEEGTLDINQATTSAIVALTPSTTSVPCISAKISSAQRELSCISAAASTTSNALVDKMVPAGSTYKRLGYWMCRLCRSQKYLRAQPPKQPSEPSTWPIRDVSKIVAHYVRMHKEHNHVERCMELGTALSANLGPFLYWVQKTKREKIPSEEVLQTIAMLRRGELPDLLRRHCAAASVFPDRNAKGPGS